MSARKKEVETESHLLTIAEREEGRLKQEIKKLEKELEDLKEKKNVFEVIWRINYLNKSHICEAEIPSLNFLFRYGNAMS